MISVLASRKLLLLSMARVVIKNLSHTMISSILICITTKAITPKIPNKKSLTTRISLPKKRNLLCTISEIHIAMLSTDIK